MATSKKSQNQLDIEKQKAFHEMWINSKMGQQMLANSIDKIDPVGPNNMYVKGLTKARSFLNENANAKHYNYLSNQYKSVSKKVWGDKSGIVGGWNNTDFIGGLSGSGFNKIIVNDKKGYNQGLQNLTHELSHASDYNGLFIPMSDVKLIENFSTPTLNKNQNGNPEYYNFLKYVAEPTETRARLQNFRKNAFDQNLYNPFEEKLKLENLKNYKPTPNEFDPLKQLRQVYTDEQIVELGNTISKNNSQSQANLGYALNGAMLDNDPMQIRQNPFASLIPGNQTQQFDFGMFESLGFSQPQQTDETPQSNFEDVSIEEQIKPSSEFATSDTPPGQNGAIELGDLGKQGPMQGIYDTRGTFKPKEPKFQPDKAKTKELVKAGARAAIDLTTMIGGSINSKKASDQEKMRMRDLMQPVSEVNAQRYGSNDNQMYFTNGGQMIRRADGSYSRRGLWDNIRDNRGSGKKPTKQMLEQERKIKNSYGNGGSDNLKVNYKIPLSVEQLNQNLFAQHQMQPQYFNADPNMNTPGRRALSEQMAQDYAMRQMILKGLGYADLATDVMQLGNFVPHPIGQGIGKLGNTLGMSIDAMQMGMDLRQGNYGNAAVNAGSLILPSYLGSNTFRRNSKYLKKGDALYPLTPQAIAKKANTGNVNLKSTRVNYVEPFTKTRHMTDAQLRYNQALLGALGAEGIYDATQHRNGGLPRYGGGTGKGKIVPNVYQVTPSDSGSASSPSAITVGKGRIKTKENVGNQVSSFGSAQAFAQKRLGLPYGRNISSRDTSIDLTNLPMDFARVNEAIPGTGILGGEYIEVKNPNTVRPAKNWLGSNDYYGDQYYPSNKIESFYGIENNKFKVGKASDFNPNTVIVPRRFGPSGGIDTSYVDDNGRLILMNRSTGKPVLSGVSTPNRPVGTGKFILHSPKTGKSEFNSISSSKSGADRVNRFIQQNGPAEIIQMDNGRYKTYVTNPNGLTQEDYVDYYSQDLPRKSTPGYNLIIKQNGGIMIKPENRGKFTAFANSRDMGVQEAAQYVLNNREDFSPMRVKQANFARNASKWNRQYGGDVLDMFERGGWLKRLFKRQRNDDNDYEEMDLLPMNPTQLMQEYETDLPGQMRYFNPPNTPVVLNMNDDARNIADQLYEFNDRNFRPMPSPLPIQQNVSREVPYYLRPNEEMPMQLPVRRNQNAPSVNQVINQALRSGNFQALPSVPSSVPVQSIQKPLPKTEKSKQNVPTREALRAKYSDIRPVNGFIDIQQARKLAPLSKDAIEMAKELSTLYPGSKFICDKKGCAEIAATASQSYGNPYTWGNAWDFGNNRKVLYTNPEYQGNITGKQGALPNPKNYTVPDEILKSKNVFVSLNRNNNKSSFRYADTKKYPNNLGNEHVGYGLGDGMLLHGTGAGGGHPAYYTIDDMRDGIKLEGYGPYNPVQMIKTRKNGGYLNDLQYALNGMGDDNEIVKAYRSDGTPVDISYASAQPSQWQIKEGMWTRPRTNTPSGNTIGAMEMRAYNSPTPVNTNHDWQVMDGMWSRPKGESKPYFDRSMKMDRLDPMKIKFNNPNDAYLDNLKATPITGFNTMPSNTEPQYNSIVDVLKSQGKGSSFNDRRNIATTLGINDYKGTAEQNIQLMKMMNANRKNGGDCPECIMAEMMNRFKRGGKNRQPILLGDLDALTEEQMMNGPVNGFIGNIIPEQMISIPNVNKPVIQVNPELIQASPFEYRSGVPYAPSQLEQMLSTPLQIDLNEEPVMAPDLSEALLQAVTDNIYRKKGKQFKSKSKPVPKEVNEWWRPRRVEFDPGIRRVDFDPGIRRVNFDPGIRRMNLDLGLRRIELPRRANGGSIPQVTGLPPGHPAANAIVESGEAIQFGDGQLARVAPEGPYVEDHGDANDGTYLPNVQRVLEDTSAKAGRNKKSDKLLALNGSDLNAMFGMPGMDFKGKYSHAGAFDKVTSAYDKARERYLDKNTSLAGKANLSDTQRNAMELNEMHAMMLPEKEDIFEMLFQHQEGVKQEHGISDSGKNDGLPKAELGINLFGKQNSALKRELPFLYGTGSNLGMGLQNLNANEQTTSVGGTETTTPTGTTTQTDVNKEGANIAKALNEQAARNSNTQIPLEWYDMLGPAASFINASSRYPEQAFDINLPRMNQPYKVNPQAQLNELTAATRPALRETLNPAMRAQLLANMSKGQSEILANAENTNNQIMNQFAQGNNAIGLQEAMARQAAASNFAERIGQSKTMQDQQRLQTLDDIGQLYGSNRQFNRMVNIMNTPNFEYDPATGTFKNNKKPVALSSGLAAISPWGSGKQSAGKQQRYTKEELEYMRLHYPNEYNSALRGRG